MQFSGLYRVYLPISCKKFLNRMVSTISIQLGDKDKVGFRSKLDIRSDVDEISALMNSTQR